MSETTIDQDMWPIPSPEVARRFAPVLDWLEAGAPHMDIGERKDVGFNFSVIISDFADDYAENTCRTACCIAGALLLFSHDERWVGDSSDGAYYTVGEIGIALGMTDCQFLSLFCGEMGNYSNLVQDWITPGMAAHAIRTFLATGYPEWVNDYAYLAREKALDAELRLTEISE